MVHTHNLNRNITAFNIFDSANVIKRFRKELLRSENLMAAAERFDYGKRFVKGSDANRHGICVVNNPSFGTVFLNCNFLHHRNCAHCADYSSGTARIADRLIYTILFGSMYIRMHFVKRSGQYGNYDKLRPFESFSDGFYSLIIPNRFAAFNVFDFISYNFIMLRSFKIDVIKINISAHVIDFGKVAHKPPCPAARTAADICYFNIFGMIVFKFHFLNPL